MLMIDEEREKIYSKQSATQDAQLASSIHELLEIMGSAKNAKDKRLRVQEILGTINE